MISDVQGFSKQKFIEPNISFLEFLNSSMYSIKQSSWAIYYAIDRYFPNLPEFCSNVLLSSFGDTVIQFSNKDFYNSIYKGNPLGKAILRDGIKIIVNAWNYAWGYEIGGTKIEYDIGNIAASSGKVLCKALIIGSGKYYIGEWSPGKLESISIFSNLPCEFLIKPLSFISKERQQKHKDKSYIKLAAEKIGDTDIWIKSAIEAVAKFISSNIIASTLYPVIKLSKTYGDFSEKLINDLLHQDNTLALFVSSITGKILPESIATALLSAPVRASEAYALGMWDSFNKITHNKATINQTTTHDPRYYGSIYDFDCDEECQNLPETPMFGFDYSITSVVYEHKEQIIEFLL